MSDPIRTSPSLSEISHLFLTDVRDRQTASAARPRRIPPAPSEARAAGETRAGHDASVPVNAILPDEQSSARSAASIDLSPEEFAQVGSVMPLDLASAPGPQGARKTLVTLLASHLSDSRSHVCNYAARLAAQRGRCGLIEADADALRLTCFDPSARPEDVAAEVAIAENLDGKAISHVLEELSWDIDCWVLAVGNPSDPAARGLIRSLGQWVLLAGCDHDGIVAAYRMLKGLASDSPADITLVPLNPCDASEAHGVHEKLAGAARQFLHRRIALSSPMAASAGTPSQTVLNCRWTVGSDRPHWATIASLIAGIENEQINIPEISAPAPVISPAVTMWPAPATIKPEPSAKAEVAAPEANQFPRMQKESPIPKESPMPMIDEQASDVIDLPAGASDAAILQAVMGLTRGLIACPIKPPRCEGAMLAIGHDRRLTMLAVAGRGLAQLREIGSAFGWMVENQNLLAMALPQFAIDASSAPALRLLVDHADLAADVLTPIVSSGIVTVQAYRKLRWGGKTGLLLEAA